MQMAEKALKCKKGVGSNEECTEKDENSVDGKIKPE